MKSTDSLMAFFKPQTEGLSGSAMLDKLHSAGIIRRPLLVLPCTVQQVDIQCGACEL